MADKPFQPPKLFFLMENELLFVCLGDSLTAGSPGFSGYGLWRGDITSQYGYWLDLQVKTGFPEIAAEFLNYGVGGNVVRQMIDRYTREVLFQLDHVDYVLVMGGNNDVVWHGATPEETLRDLEELFNLITNSGAKPIGLEILPVTTDQALVDGIKETNRGLFDLGERLNVPVVALYDALSDESGNGLAAEYDSGDGEHLSVAGYRKVG